MTAFNKAWDFLKADRPLGCPNCEGKIDEYTGEPSFPIPNEDRSSSTGYRCWKCGSEI
jgi:DNA-directed RNA polymerase subunit RPC12/RpoP